MQEETLSSTELDSSGVRGKRNKNVKYHVLGGLNTSQREIHAAQREIHADIVLNCKVTVVFHGQKLKVHPFFWFLYVTVSYMYLYVKVIRGNG
jgi:hypothetical protein